MLLQTHPTITEQDVASFSEQVTLDDGRKTTIHVVRYDRSKVVAKVVLFDYEVNLLSWCHENGYQEGLNGGFFLRSNNLPLGDVWHDGVQYAHEPYGAGWCYKRGSIGVSPEGALDIKPRPKFPTKIDGSLLEIGPTLVHQGLSIFLMDKDPEGFSDTANQHDEDINAKRHPRAGIGLNDESIWTVTVDGRSKEDAGMFLDEFAEVFVALGATEAVNVDGGRSSTQITHGKIINKPRTDHQESSVGFPVRNGIVFTLRQ
jgi:exopolysaccharide biosynthesis protein